MSEEPQSFEPGTRSHKIRKKFLDTLSKGFTVSKAAKATGLSVRHFKRWKEEDANFAEDWDEAVESGMDSLEDVAIKRGKRASDGLLTTMMRANRPDKFRTDKGADINVKVNNVTANIDSELERKIAKALGENPSGSEAAG